MVKRNNVSPEVVTEAMQVAKATQKPGQTKEQTKLIALGIQKGIEEYKKRHKEKARELDKQKRRLQQTPPSKVFPTQEQDEVTPIEDERQQSPLAWILLALSWLGFIGYFYLLHP